MIMTLAIIVGIYFGGMILAYIWDAKFGWGEDPDTVNHKPLSFEDLFWWPAAMLLLPVFLLGEWATKSKANRIEKAREKKRLRIALENERRIELMNLERELYDARENQNDPKSSRARTSTSIRF